METNTDTIRARTFTTPEDMMAFYRDMKRRIPPHAVAPVVPIKDLINPPPPPEVFTHNPDPEPDPDPEPVLTGYALEQNQEYVAISALFPAAKEYAMLEDKSCRWIQKYIAWKHDVTVADIVGKCRIRHYVLPRYELDYILHRVKGFSLNYASKFTGRSDHTSVLHGAKKWEQHLLATGGCTKPKRETLIQNGKTSPNRRHAERPRKVKKKLQIGSAMYPDNHNRTH